MLKNQTKNVHDRVQRHTTIGYCECSNAATFSYIIINQDENTKAYLSNVAAKIYLPLGENLTNDTGGLSSSAMHAAGGMNECALSAKYRRQCALVQYQTCDYCMWVLF